MLLVDSVTGIGGVETRTDDWGIDFILTGSQKSLALPPGLAFGVANEAMLERSTKAPAKGWYFDLVDLYDQITRHQTPATPAISLLYALDFQLTRIAEETIEGRWQRHRAMQERTIRWVEEARDRGVDVDVFAEAGHRSPTVTCVTSDRPAEIVAAMSERGWVIGGGYGKIKDNTFRIGHMGDHTLDELESLLEVLDEVLA
jgi:aspartate aminotransferase-like enzyme